MIIDFREIISAKMTDLEESGAIQKTIEEGIEKTVLGAISSALGDYKLKNDIEKKVEAQVSKIVSDIGFTAYNSFIAEKVKAITEGICQKDIADKIEKMFNEMLIMKRDSIKLSEIFEAYREWICQEVDECEKYNLEHFYVKFEENERYGWFDITLAKEKPSGRFSDYAIRFTVHRKNQDKTEGWISSVYIDGIDVKQKIRLGHMSDVDLLLVNIAYNNTPIEIDVESEDDIDYSFDVDI